MVRRTQKLVQKTVLNNTFIRYDLVVDTTHNFVASGIVVHNSNCRVGLITENDKPTWAAGSHNVRRKKNTQNGQLSLYWTPLEHSNMREMINDLYDDNHANSVLVFCELVGKGLQDMSYNDKLEYYVFDISINGNYLPFFDVLYNCGIYGIPTVPVLATSPHFDVNKLMECTDGPTTIAPCTSCSFKGREGCVVHPYYKEAIYGQGRRLILKSVSVDYLSRKGATDNA
jgi:hypothetical protein